MWYSKNGCTRYTIKKLSLLVYIPMDFNSHWDHIRKSALHAGWVPTMTPTGTPLALPRVLY